MFFQTCVVLRESRLVSNRRISIKIQNFNSIDDNKILKSSTIVTTRLNIQNLFFSLNLSKDSGIKKSIKKLIDRTKESPQKLVEEAILLGFMDEYENAIEKLDRALYLSSDIWEGSSYKSDVLNYKGAALFNLDKFEEAIKVYDESLKLNPKNYLSWNNKAQLLFELERYDEAANAIEKALENLEDKEDEQLLLVNKTLILTYGDKSEQSLKLIKKILKENSENYRVWLSKGVALSDLDKQEEAIEAFNEGLKIEPESLDLLIPKGVALLDFEKYEDALDCFEKAIKIDPTEELAWYNKACALSFLNKKDEAFDALFVAISIEPENLVNMREEEDFENIKTTEKFQELLNRSI